MQVKIGNEVFDAEEIPILLILSDKDKFNISHMDPEATKYATFPEDWGTKDEMWEWMEE